MNDQMSKRRWAALQVTVYSLILIAMGIGFWMGLDFGYHSAP